MKKNIILDDYSADITFLTAVISSSQMNALADCLEQILTNKEADSAEILSKIESITADMFDNEVKIKSLLPQAQTRWYEQIRPLDVFCCVNRLRGLKF